MLETFLSGAVTGFLGSIVNNIYAYKNKKLDLELNKQKFENELALKQISANAIIEVEDSKAFKEALTSEPQRYYTGNILTPIQRWFMLGLDFVRGLVRPVLTWYLCTLTTIIYFKAERLIEGDFLLPTMAFDLANQIINTVLYLTVTCVCFWFGSRGNKAPKK